MGHFVCTSLALQRKRKETLATNSQRLASLRTFGSSSRQLISRLIFDQRHVKASHDALAGIVCCKTKRLEWTMAHCSGTKLSTCMQRFSLWALSVASSPWSQCHRKFARAVRRAWTRKTFGICRTRMPVRICTDGPFRPHFAGARAKGKRSSQKRLTASRFFEKLRCLQTQNSLGKRTGLPVRPNELRRTRKTSSASKMRTLFRSLV